jgi:AcrR family transcriptional regulator
MSLTRLQPTVDHVLAQRLLDAAVACFDRYGYRGTPVRLIAADAGCSTAAFYAHFRSKADLLLEIVDGAYTAALAEVEAAVALAGEDPAQRLEAAIWAHCDYRLRHRRACRVADAELAHVPAQRRGPLHAKRVRPGQIISEIVYEGAASGAFVTEPEAASRELATMCGAVGSYPDQGGQVVPRQIAERCCEFAAQMVGAPPAHGSSTEVPTSVRSSMRRWTSGVWANGTAS